MAHTRSRQRQSHSSYTQSGRDTKAIARRSLPRSVFIRDRWASDPIASKRSGLFVGGTMNEVEDRRTFHPLGELRNPRSIVGGYTQFRPRPVVSRNVYDAPSGFGFLDAQRVLLCVRRRVRREVMHARGIAGGSVRPPRFNFWSRISCKG